MMRRILGKASAAVLISLSLITGALPGDAGPGLFEAYAETTGTGLEYKKDDTHVEITGYKGEGTDLLEIPAEIDGLPVTSISERAFSRIGEDGKYIKKVVINADIKKLPAECFYMCWGLEEIVLPEGLQEIGDRALIWNKLKSLTIPDSVTKLGSWCIGENFIEELEIPDSVTELGDSAIGNAHHLKKIKFGTGVKEIMSGQMCGGCEKLEEVIIPEGVTQIQGAFVGCDSLKRIILPESMEIIGHCFSECPNLAAIYVPENTRLDLTEYNAIPGCGIPSMFEESDFLTIYGYDNDYYLWNEDHTGGDASAKKFAEEYGFPFVLVDSVNDVPGNEEIKFKEEEIDGFKVTVISENACRIDSYIGGDSDVTVPDKLGNYEVRAMTADTFKDKFGEPLRFVESVTFATEHMKTLEGMFSQNTTLKKIVFTGNGIRRIKMGAAGGGVGTGSVEEIEIPEGVTFIDYGAFMCSGLKKITLPSTLKILNSNAFENCYYLEEIAIPEGITDLTRGFTFNNCIRLKKVSLPESLKRIDAFAFAGCESLKEINLPDGLEVIGEGSFNGCAELKEIEIPSSVNEIGTGAFSRCYGLRRAYFKGDIDKDKFGIDNLNEVTRDNWNYEPWYAIFDEEGEVFKDCDYLTLYGDGGSYIEDYADENGIAFETGAGDTVDIEVKKIEGITYNIYDDMAAVTGCPEDADSIEIPDEIDGKPVKLLLHLSHNTDAYSSKNNQDEYMGPEQDSVKSVSINAGIRRLPRRCFACFSKMETVTLPDTLEVVGEEAFAVCFNLSDVPLPDSVKEIRTGAFRSCTGLDFINIPEKTEIIGNSAFHLAKELLKVDIRDNTALKKVEEDAFYSCDKLENIAFPDSIPADNAMKFEKNAFRSCRVLSGVYLPESLKKDNMGLDIFSGSTFVVINSPKGSEAIEYARENSIKYIEIEDTDSDVQDQTISQNSFEAVIPFDTIDNLEDGQDLTVMDDETAVVFDEDAANNIRNCDIKGTLTLEKEMVDGDEIPEVIQETIGENEDYDKLSKEEIQTISENLADQIAVISEEDGIVVNLGLTDEKGGGKGSKKVSFSKKDAGGYCWITMPFYGMPDGKTVPYIYYLSPSGKPELIDQKYCEFDYRDHTVKFRTSHFSLYGISSEELTEGEKPKDQDKGGNKNEEVLDNNSTVPVGGRIITASKEGLTIDGKHYSVSFNETMLTYTGKSLKKLLAKALIFTDDEGNRKEIKSVSAKAKDAGTIVIKKIVFTDNTKLKAADLSNLEVKIVPREVSMNAAVNGNGAVVYGVLNTNKTKIKNGEIKKLYVDMPNWDKNASDTSEGSLKSGKQYVGQKVNMKKDVDSQTVSGDNIIVRLKNNYCGDLIIPNV